MMKLRINPIVTEDLKNIKEYIVEDNEEMAVKTIQEIYDQIENIQQLLYKIGKEYVEIYRVVNRYQDITEMFE